MTWKQIRNYLYVPNNALENQSKYLCRLIVRDKKFVQLKTTIIFVTHEKKLFLINEAFPFDY